MRWIALLPVLYLAAVADTALADALRIGPVAPDFLTLGALVWLLAIDRPGAFLAAGVFGLTADLISPGRIGLGAAAILLAGYVAARMRARFALEHVAWQVAIASAAATSASLILAVGRWLLGELPIPLSAALMGGAGVGLYTGAVSIPCLLIAGWIREPLANRKRRLETT